MKKQNCKWFKKLLGKYLDNEINSATRKKIDEHLSECESCQAEFNVLKEVNSVSKSPLYLEPSEDYWESIIPRVRSKIEEEIKETAWERFAQFFGEFFGYNNLARNVAGAAAAAVIIIFVVKITNQQLEFISQKPKETEKMEIAEKVKIPQEETHRAEPAEIPSLKKPEGKSEKPQAPKPPKVVSADISEEKRTISKEKLKESISEIKETEKIETPLKVEISPEEKIALKKEEAVAVAVKEEPKSVSITLKDKGKLEEKTDKFETAVVVKPLEEKKVPPAETITSEDEKILERGKILKYEEKPSIIIPQEQKEDIFNKTIRSPLFDKRTSLRNGFIELEQQRRLKRTEIPQPEIKQSQKDILVKQKNEIINFLKNNNDNLLNIVKLKELDEIYLKLLSLEYDEKIFQEAGNFYKNNKEKLIEILGINEYAKRLKILKEINRYDEK